MFIELIAALMWVSCPAQTCSVPLHLMTPFRNERIALPAIVLKTSPIPMVPSPGFLSYDIKWQDRKVYGFNKINTQFLDDICKCHMEITA